MIKKSSNSTLITLLNILLLIALLTGTNSQETQGEKLFKELLDKFNQTSIIFHNITKKMERIKYNFILKIKYKYLETKNKNIEKKINDIKEYFNTNKLEESNLMKEIYNLNEHFGSYIKSCYKTINLYNSFENLKELAINLIKIFFFIFIIVLIFAIIISGIIYIYRYRKRKSYEILREEFSHSSFRNINDLELETKTKKKKGKLIKK